MNLCSINATMTQLSKPSDLSSTPLPVSALNQVDWARFGLDEYCHECRGITTWYNGKCGLCLEAEASEEDPQ